MTGASRSVRRDDPAVRGRRAENLRRLRDSLSLTQEAMAEQCGVGFASSWSNLETGEKPISIRRIDRIAAGVGWTPARLLAYLDEETTP